MFGGNMSKGWKITTIIVASILLSVFLVVGVYYFWPWNSKFFKESTKEFERKVKEWKSENSAQEIRKNILIYYIAVVFAYVDIITLKNVPTW